MNVQVNPSLEHPWGPPPAEATAVSADRTPAPLPDIRGGDDAVSEVSEPRSVQHPAWDASRAVSHLQHNVASHVRASTWLVLGLLVLLLVTSVSGAIFATAKKSKGFAVFNAVVATGAAGATLAVGMSARKGGFIEHASRP